jgi:hypothetical protein
MKDVVVILNAQEISVVQQFCATLPEYEVFLFDVVLSDPAIAAKLHNVQVVTEIAAPSHVSIDREAHSSARALEEALDVAQRGRSGVSILSWQHLNFFCMFIALRWYTALWQSVGTRLAGRRVHVPVNQCPTDYYFDSFVPAMALLEYLQVQHIDCVAYEYGAAGVPLDSVPDLTGDARGDQPPGDEPLGGHPEWLLTHLPTCIYDHAYFGQEMRASKKRIINLQARRWDVPVEADQTIGLVPMTQLLSSLPSAIQERIAAACGALSENLERLLLPHFGSPVYRARQIESFVNLYRGQFATYFGLETSFHTDLPAKLVLSEHDTGFHGPLVSFAASRSLSVILLPHSKIMGDVEFGYRNIVALTHPMQGTSIHDRNDRPVTSHTLAYPESFCGTSEIGNGLRTISLMLNSPTLNGVHFTPPDAYLEGIKRIVAWCRAQDVQLKIRCKPGFPLFGLLRAYVGADPAVLARNVSESMDEHVQGCDLCLMYDMPTSGSLFFLRRSLPILNPIVAELTKHQRSLVRADLIVPESVEATLCRLDGFRADPLTLYAFRAAQYHAYVTGFARARPLRCYL